VEREPARKLLFRAAKTGDAANALETVDPEPTPPGATKQVSDILAREHSAADVIAPAGAASHISPARKVRPSPEKKLA